MSENGSRPDQIVGDDEIRDITVIGAGPVGLITAFWAGMREASSRIIDSLPELGGQLTTLYPEKWIYDVPGFPRIIALSFNCAWARHASATAPAASGGTLYSFT